MKSFLLGVVSTALSLAAIGAAKPIVQTAQNNKNNQHEVVDLKDKVMRSYYNELDDSTKEEINYGDFESRYYESGLHIREYTDTIKSHTNSVTNTAVTRGIAGGEDDDARHIISNYRKMNGTGERPSLNNVLPSFNKNSLSRTWDENHTMCFSFDEGRNPDVPVYFDRDELETEEERAAYVPWYQSYVRPGDIVWDTISSVGADIIDVISHMALITNTCKRGYTIDLQGNYHYFNYVETIEAFSSGVRFGFLDDQRVLECGVKILRVSSPKIDWTNAIDFCLHQYGEQYYIDVLETDYPIPDESRDRWYCTQLVFVAFLRCGYEITYVPNNPVWYDPKVVNGKITGAIAADMIYVGRDVSEVVFYDHMIQPSEYMVVDKQYDNIRFKNYSDKTALVHYSNKKQYWNTAWKNFRTICDSTISIDRNKTKTVDISSGGFLANTIPLWIKDGTAMRTTLAHEYAGSWINSHYGSTFDEFEAKCNGTNCTITIKNNSASAETYYYASKFLNCTEARAWDLPIGVIRKSVYIPANSTVTVNVTKTGNNDYLPFVLMGSTETNNAVLIRMTSNTRFYFSATPAHILATSAGSLTPVYPKVTIQCEQQVYFNGYSIREFGHGQADLYVLELSIPFDSNVPESAWDTVEYHDYEDISNGDFFNESVYVGMGCFSLTFFTHNPYAFGCIYLYYTYEAELILDSISISGNPQTDFLVGQNVNTDNLVIKAHYTCGYSKTISKTNENLSIYTQGYDMSAPGTYSIVAEYTESGITRSASYDVTVRYPNVNSAYVSGNYQDEFEVGDEFNYDGLEVYAVLETGVTVRVYDFEVDDSEVNMSCEDLYEVYITFTVNGVPGSTSYLILVEKPALQSIDLDGEYQTVFEEGDEFNYDGLQVVAYYTNGTSEYVSDFVVDDSYIRMSQVGSYPVMVSYTENGITKTTAYIITVEERQVVSVLESITLSGNYKTEFDFGESFSSAGLVVTAHYSDGTSKEVTDYTVDSSTYDFLSPNNYEITVSYTENGISASVTYTVRVKSFQPITFNLLASISLSGNYKTIFRVGQSFNYSGLIVTANYRDGTSSVVTNYVVDDREVDMSSEGAYVVRVSYTEGRVTKTATYTILVVERLRPKGEWDIVIDPKDPIIITRP